MDVQEPNGGHTRVTPDGRILSSIITIPSQDSTNNDRSGSGSSGNSKSVIDVNGKNRPSSWPSWFWNWDK